MTKRVPVLREIELAGEVGPCSFFVDPECSNFPGRLTGELPVYGEARNLSALLEWNASWPTTQEMAIELRCFQPNQAPCDASTTRWSGPSPLAISIEEILISSPPEASIEFLIDGSFLEDASPFWVGSALALPQEFEFYASFEDWVYPSNGTSGDRWID